MGHNKEHRAVQAGTGGGRGRGTTSRKRNRKRRQRISTTSPKTTSRTWGARKHCGRDAQPRLSRAGAPDSLQGNKLKHREIGGNSQPTSTGKIPPDVSRALHMGMTNTYTLHPKKQVDQGLQDPCLHPTRSSKMPPNSPVRSQPPPMPSIPSEPTGTLIPTSPLCSRRDTERWATYGLRPAALVKVGRTQYETLTCNYAFFFPLTCLTVDG